MLIKFFIFENHVVHGMNARNMAGKETHKILWQTKHNIAAHVICKPGNSDKNMHVLSVDEGQNRVNILVPVIYLRWTYIISYYVLSFRGSLQDYKIHMGMEIVNTVHKSNKNVCLRSQEIKSV